MSILEIKEAIPTFNSRSTLGGVVISPPTKMAGTLSAHTTDQVRSCCGRLFLTFESYMDHLQESPGCETGVCLEPSGNSELDEDEDTGFCPIINSVSSLSSIPVNIDDIEEVEIFEEEPRTVDLHHTKNPLDWSTPPTTSQNLLNCNWCHITFSSKMDLVRHQKEQHPNNVDTSETPGWKIFKNISSPGPGNREYKYNCSLCNGTFVQISHLKTHMSNCHVENGFACNLCSCSFLKERGLKIHHTLSHTSTRRKKDSNFKNKETNKIKISSSIVKRDRIKCPQCSFSCNFKTALTQHLKLIHKNNNKFPCDICTRKFNSFLSLKVHRKILHNVDTKVYGKTEESSDQHKADTSETRLYSVGESSKKLNLHQCSKCSYTCKLRIDLKSHERNSHVDDGFNCRQCTCSFISMSELDHHTLQLHTQTVSTKSLIYPQSTTSLDGNTQFKRALGLKTKFKKPSIKGKPSKCSKCNKTFKHSAAKWYHEKNSHILNGFACNLCTCSFMTVIGLSRHKTLSHSKKNGSNTFNIKRIIGASEPRITIDKNEINTLYPNHQETMLSEFIHCTRCSFKSKLRSKLLEHVEISHPANKFHCNLCSKVFPTKIKLKLHNSKLCNSVKNSTQNVSLPIEHEEDKVSTSAKNQIKTYKTGSKKKLCVPVKKTPVHQCKKCLKTFQFNYSLKYHDKTAHFQNGIKCDFCVCTFETLQGKRVHLKLLHKSEESIDSHSNMDAHKSPKIKLLKNSNSRFSCKFCEFTCSLRGELMKHKSAVHALKNRFNCDLCNRSFNHVFGLKLHKMNSHKRQHASIINTGGGLKPAIYKCSKCTYTSATQRCVVKHEMISHIQNGFACNKCVCSFATGPGLRKHIERSHTKKGLNTKEVKPVVEVKSIKQSQYSCSKCSFVGYRAELTRHEKISHVQNGFDCDLCTRCFGSDTGLKQHRLVFHKVDSSINKKATFHRVSDVKNVNEEGDDDLFNVAPKVNKKSAIKVMTSEPEPSSSTKNEFSYACDKCPYVVNKEPQFLYHQKVAHVTNGYACDQCSCAYKTISGVTIHKGKVHKHTTINSPIKEKTVIKSPIKVKTVKKTPTKFIPEDVPEVENKLDEVKTKEDYQCSKCNGTFQSEFILRKHETYAHIKNGFPCPECGCKFKTEKGMRNHLSYHSSSKKIKKKVDQTKKQVYAEDKKSEELVLEAKTKSAVPSLNPKFFCPKCTHSTGNKTWLETHLKAAHVENGHKCDYCPCAFASTGGLKSHIFRKHGQESTKISNVEEEPINRKRKMDSIESDNENDDLQTKAKVKFINDNQEPTEKFQNKPRGPKYRPIKCKACQKTCFGLDDLNNHKDVCVGGETGDEKSGSSIKIPLKGNVSNNTDRQRCKDCACIFRTESELNTHIRIRHSGNKRQKNCVEEENSDKEYNFTSTTENNGIQKVEYKCNKCSFSTEFLSNIVSHSKTSHTNGEYGCPKCSCIFKKRMQLIYHKFFFHNNKMCGDGGFYNEGTPSVSEDRFERKIHSCGASFSDADDAVKCIICKQSFNRNSYSNHLQLCHSQIKGAFKCDMCACSYSTRSALQKHIGWSHKRKSIRAVYSTLPELTEDDPKKPYKCEKCGLKFELTASLEAHSKDSHTSGANQCVICSCSFSTLFGLDSHVSGVHKFTWEITPSSEGHQQSDSESLKQDNEKEELINDSEPEMPELEQTVENFSANEGSNSSKVDEDDLLCKESEPEDQPNEGQEPANFSQLRIKKRSAEHLQSSSSDSKKSRLPITCTVPKAIEPHKFYHPISMKRGRGRPRKRIVGMAKNIKGSKRRIQFQNMRTNFRIHSDENPSSSSSVNVPNRNSEVLNPIIDKDNDVHVENNMEKDSDISHSPYKSLQKAKISMELESKRSPQRQASQNNNKNDATFKLQVNQVSECRNSIQKEERNDEKPSPPKIFRNCFESSDYQLTGRRPQRKSAENALRVIGRMLEECKQDEVEHESEEISSEKYQCKLNELKLQNKLYSDTSSDEDSIPQENPGPSRNFHDLNAKTDTLISTSKLHLKTADMEKDNDSRIIIKEEPKKISNKLMPGKSSEFNNTRTNWYKEFVKYMCSRCGIAFPSNIPLTTHFQGCAGQIKQFPCRLCDSQFRTLLKLKEHLWRIHKPQHEQETGIKTFLPTSNDGPVEFNCSLCKQRLNDRKAYILHMSVPHLFRCKKCSFVCGTKSAMDTHKEKEHVQKPVGLVGSQNLEIKIESEKSETVQLIRRSCMGTKSDGIKKAPIVCPSDPSDEVSIVFESPCKRFEQKCDNSPNIQAVDVNHVFDEGRSHDSTPKSSDQSSSSSEIIEPQESMAVVESPLNTSSDKEMIQIMSILEPEVNESMICDECGYFSSCVEDARDHNKAIENDASLICDKCAYFANTHCESILHSKSHHETDESISSDSSVIEEDEDVSTNPTVSASNNDDAPQLDKSFQIEVEFQNSQSAEDIPYLVAQEVEVALDNQNSSVPSDLVLFDISELNNFHSGGFI